MSPEWGNIGAHIVAFLLDHGNIVTELEPHDCVLHKCDNPPCCRPRHLFKGTKKDNTHDMMVKGRHRFMPNRFPIIVGSGKWNAKLDEDKVVEILRARADGVGQKRLAGQYGVSYQVIQNIEHRRTWKHVRLSN